MIHEFALEPELVATWGDRNNFRYFITKFGLSEGRLISRYPKKWKKMVWDAFHVADDMERKRMEELIIRIAEKMIVRSNYLWDQTKSWFDNADEEHQRHSFRAILARQNPHHRDYVLVGEELGQVEQDLWNVKAGISVKRIASEMSSAVSDMLSNCSMAIFIDPHFGPENLRHRRPLEEFLAAILNKRGGQLPSRIEVHASNDRDAVFFENTCKGKLPELIPLGLKVKFIQWKRKPDGEKLHNRYILTDVGGVAFQVGLDEGDEQETDDISLLNRTQYELRWSQYASQNPAFDLFNFVEIEGKRTIE